MSSLLNKVLEKRRTSLNIMDSIASLPRFSKAKVIAEYISSYAKFDRTKDVVIMGDYDVDGVTSTAMLTKTLKKLFDVDAITILSNRFEGGYGVHQSMMDKVPEGSLVIMVDMGINEVDNVQELRNRSCDVIVIDHHESKGIIPNANILFDPKVGCNQFTERCAAGLTLSVCLELDKENLLTDYLYTLAMLGTLADQVPLVEDNRFIVKEGLKRLVTLKNPNLSQLLDLQKVREITSTNLAFSICPVLNAPGRMESPDKALEFLLEEQFNFPLVTHVITKNEERKKLVKALYDKHSGSINPKATVIVVEDDLALGVAGILAGTFSREFNKPCVVLSRGVGSCRTVQGVSIFNLISEYSEYFKVFGGHHNAAGFKFKEELKEEFIAKISTADTEAARVENEEDASYPIEITLDDVDLLSVKELMSLEPYGVGNKEPIFITNKIPVFSYRFVGSKNNVLQVETGNRGKKVICFNCTKEPEDFIKGTYTLQVNTFNAFTSVQLVMSEWENFLERR